MCSVPQEITGDIAWDPLCRCHTAHGKGDTISKTSDLLLCLLTNTLTHSAQSEVRGNDPPKSPESSVSSKKESIKWMCLQQTLKPLLSLMDWEGPSQRLLHYCIFWSGCQLPRFSDSEMNIALLRELCFRLIKCFCLQACLTSNTPSWSPELTLSLGDQNGSYEATACCRLSKFCYSTPIHFHAYDISICECFNCVSLF